MIDDILRNLECAEDGPENPLPLFQKWLEDATRLELNDPNAMALATIDANGRPSLRMVLLKGADQDGFVFFTNRESRKGEALKANPLAALCFHWKSIRRQVRVEGSVERISDAESDAYYNTRAIGSRLGAWASQQSRPLDSRSQLADRVAALEKEYNGQPEIPRPPYWGGYRVKPVYYEFWQDGTHRLHTRLVYEPGPNGWTRRMIYP